MTFPDTDPTEENGIGVLFDKGEAENILDLEAIDFLGPVPLERIEGFDEREAGQSHPAFDATTLTGLCLAFDEPFKKLQMGPMLGGGLLGEGLVVLADKG